MPKAKQKPNLSKHVAALRISFGVLWVVDAFLKWQPAFKNGFADAITSAGQGQPSWLQPWFHFWNHLLTGRPQVFALLTAIIESLIALALLLGLARRVSYLLAAVFSLLVWAVPEGFGGPYSSGSTDVGAGIVYAVALLSLYGLDRLAQKASWSVDGYIARHIPWWAVVANP